ncbi:hypothetical protein B4U80_14980, partial [Leptotrombidium deliense]
QSYVGRLKAIVNNVVCVNISDLAAGNGGVHCMTQVVQRE